MGLMPRRSTERIDNEFLPCPAEQEWITKFRPRSTDTILVNIARSCCDGFRPTDDEAQCCLNVLFRPPHEKDWKAEVFAIWILGFIKPSHTSSDDAQQRIVKLAFSAEPFHKRTLQELYRSGRLIVRSAVFTGALFLPLFIQWAVGYFSLSRIVAGIIFGSLMGGLGGICLTPLFLPLSMCLHNLQEREIQKAALHTLRRWNDPRLLGTVAYASLKADAATLGQIQMTFASLLTQLTPDYYGLMPAGTTDDLCRALEASDEFLKPNILNPNMTTTVKLHLLFAKNLLQALELVGSGQSAKYVRAVIEARNHSEVVELAKRVLPILTEREHEETARTTLLRHSSLPASSDELLRAASPSPTQNDTETLMRPVL